jgi:methylenetetrahydrofolate dehydrogenase (NADP+)/methenyltetrahydrofolate cyclohydrolase
VFIDGLTLAANIKDQVKRDIAKAKAKPKLAVLLASNDEASQAYVQKKREACQEVGIESELITGFKNYTELMNEILQLNVDSSVHGILVQLPLNIPNDQNYALGDVLSLISNTKDVDGFCPNNIGNVRLQTSGFKLSPCTPTAIIELLKYHNIPIEGRTVTIINDSNVVGKPLADMILAEKGTVIICNKYTDTGKLPYLCGASDIIVVGVGQPGFLKGNMVNQYRNVESKPTIIDVGINRVDGKLVGDVSPEVEKYGYLTKVPGGVGPVTVSVLMRNTFEAWFISK